MAGRRQRFAVLGLGALVLTLGAAAAIAFTSPSGRSLPPPHLAVYELAALDPAMPLHDERASAWIVALPEGGYRAFSDVRPLPQPPRRCPLLWRTRDELNGYGWTPPPSDPGWFQDTCRTFDLFDVRGRPACVIDPTLLRSGGWLHLEEFAVSVDVARGLLIVDLNATTQQLSACRYPPDVEHTPSAPAAPPSPPG